MRVGPTLDQLLEEYKGKIKVVYKHFVVHPGSATTPALAACAADKQGKFKEMYDGIWKKGFSVTPRNLGEDNMKKIAGEIGLNVDKFTADMKGECPSIIKKDQGQLSQVGTRGTPAFYINGRYLSGAQPIGNFKRFIDEEIKKADSRIEKGEATAANYYSKFVMEKGLKRFDAKKAAKLQAERAAKGKR